MNLLTLLAPGVQQLTDGTLGDVRNMADARKVGADMLAGMTGVDYLNDINRWLEMKAPNTFNTPTIK